MAFCSVTAISIPGQTSRGSPPSFHRVGRTEAVEPRPDTVGPWPAGPTCEPAPRGPCRAASSAAP
jgi:hypothetical protein